MVAESVVQYTAFHATPSHRLQQRGQETKSADTGAQVLLLNSSLGHYMLYLFIYLFI